MLTGVREKTHIEKVQKHRRELHIGYSLKPSWLLGMAVLSASISQLEAFPSLDLSLLT